MEEFTVFECGPNKKQRECEHDYSGPGEKVDNGWTAVCSKCGLTAIDESLWLSDEI